MAISKNFFASSFLVLALLVLHFVPSHEISIRANDDESSAAPLISPNLSPVSSKIDCGGRCAERCSKSSRPNLCHRACGTCCARCNCVPSGTYGNYDECPCYANLTTHGGRKKCP